MKRTELKRSKAKIGKDATASLVLKKYAAWHLGVKEKELCAPCNHCSGGDNCHPCGTREV